MSDNAACLVDRVCFMEAQYFRTSLITLLLAYKLASILFTVEYCTRVYTRRLRQTFVFVAPCSFGLNILKD